MKHKTYQTAEPKLKNKNKMAIKVDWLSIPNKMHLDAQIHHPAKVHEDKRFKKPKHKNKDIDW